MSIWTHFPIPRSTRKALKSALASVLYFSLAGLGVFAHSASADQAFRVPTSDRVFIGSVLLPGGHQVGFEARENTLVTVHDLSRGFKYAITLSSPTQYGEPFDEGVIDHNVSYNLRLYQIDRLGDLSEASVFLEEKRVVGRRIKDRAAPTLLSTPHGRLKVWVERVATYPFNDQELRDYLMSLDHTVSRNADLLEDYFGVLSGTTCCVACDGSVSCGTVVIESCGSCRSSGGGPHAY